MSSKLHDYKWVNLKVNSRCNLNCNYCYETGMHGKELSIDEICLLMDDLKALGIKSIKLSGGEPLIRKDLEQIIEKARTDQFSVQLATNGTLLTEERLVSLEQSGLTEIYVSLGDRPGDGTISILDKLCKYAVRKNLKIRLGANVIVGRTFLNHFEEYMNKFNLYGINYLYIIPPKKGGDAEWFEAEKLSICDYAKLNKMIIHYSSHLHFILDCSFYWLNAGTENKYRCNAARNCFAISHDGNIIPCTFFNDKEFVAGNIRERSLEKILNENTFDHFHQYVDAMGEIKKVTPCI